MAEYDGPKLLRAVYDSTRELVQQSGIAPEDVATLCLDGMISGTLGIDEDGDATTPYTTTFSTRVSSRSSIGRSRTSTIRSAG